MFWIGGDRKQASAQTGLLWIVGSFPEGRSKRRECGPSHVNWFPFISTESLEFSGKTKKKVIGSVPSISTLFPSFNSPIQRQMGIRWLSIQRAHTLRGDNNTHFSSLNASQFSPAASPLFNRCHCVSVSGSGWVLKSAMWVFTAQDTITSLKASGILWSEDTSSLG